MTWKMFNLFYSHAFINQGLYLIFKSYQTNFRGGLKGWFAEGWMALGLPGTRKSLYSLSTPH